MNDADRSFIAEHRIHINNTLEMISSGLTDDTDKVKQVGIATLVMNLYTGMEIIIQHILLDKNIRIQKSAHWHKELLSEAVRLQIISAEMQSAMSDYMKFRHRHTHGYGYMDDWDIVKTLSERARATVEKFFFELEKNGYL